MPLCPLHQREMMCPACIGQRGARKGGQSTSPKKSASSRANMALAREVKARLPRKAKEPTVKEAMRILEAALARKAAMEAAAREAGVFPAPRLDTDYGHTLEGKEFP